MGLCVADGRTGTVWERRMAGLGTVWERRMAGPGTVWVGGRQDRGPYGRGGWQNREPYGRGGWQEREPYGWADGRTGIRMGETDRAGKVGKNRIGSVEWEWGTERMTF